MASIDVAKLLNKITQDIPGINTVLKALANWDVSALSDVPDGAMQATTDTNNNLTINKKVSGSYTPVAKLMHDVDKLDGYHASASATANAVAVRNAQGALPGNILGNSATADTATALAAGSVVPVNQGGTGATTAAQARTNLGVAGSSDFTAHIAQQASTSVEGHVKLDALAADGSNTAAPGGFGLGKTGRVDNLDLVMDTCFFCYNPGAIGLPSGLSRGGVGITISYSANDKLQNIYTNHTPPQIFTRKRTSIGWEDWVPRPNGITDSTDLVSSTTAASATAVSSVRDEVVSARSIANSAVTAADYAQTKSGTSSTASGTAAKVVTCSGFKLSTNARIFVTFSNANTVAAALTLNVNGTGAKSIYNQTGIISTSNTALFAANQPIEFRYDGVGWVFDDVKLGAQFVGDLSISFATTRSGSLLCNGGTYSRTTYAALFAILGTSFGAGDGSTTFNVPDFRGRTIQGANANLKAVLDAGLPDIQGTPPANVLTYDPAMASASGAITRVSYDLTYRPNTGGVSGGSYVWKFKAGDYNSIYGASTTVQSPAIAVNIFIKY